MVVLSRDREQQRHKRSELARQLGVKRGEVEEHKELQEHERVTRPAFRLHARKATGLLARLLDRAEPLALALYLVDVKGARLVDAFVLDGTRHELAKLVYRRPAHFVIVVLTAAEPAPVLAALKTASLSLDGISIASDALATQEWEAPRRVRIEGLPSPHKASHIGAALSIRGVGRTATRHELPLDKLNATVDIEL